MIPEINTTPWQLAIHEAGHAVMAHRLGCKLGPVIISQGEQKPAAKVAARTPLQEILVGIAGGEAERLLGFDDSSLDARDVNNARERIKEHVTRRHSGSTFDEAYRIEEKIFARLQASVRFALSAEPSRRAIEALAAELTKAVSMKGHAAEAVIERALGGREPGSNRASDPRAS